MGMLEIVGGFLLIVLCVIIIAAVTAQESKSGLGTIAGESSGTFFDKNRGKTKDAMLVRATTISGIAMAVVTLIVLFASLR
ncbi:MAG: Preprotein translocase SecG subunit [Oscillospiraceae bacterium]|jgi:preprotein translocase subunit SecG|nr:Preprotein translocase SecG subunit [Oscillospiraceae bacterium]